MKTINLFRVSLFFFLFSFYLNAQGLRIESSVGGAYCKETIYDSTLQVVGGGTTFLWNNGEKTKKIWVDVKKLLGNVTYWCIVNSKDTLFYKIRVYPYIKSSDIEVKKGMDEKGVYWYTTFPDTLVKNSDIFYYLFKKNSENIFERIYADSTEKFFRFTELGDYKIRIVTPCTGNTISISIGTLTSSEDLNSDKLKVYPNPARDCINISHSGESLIYDISRKLVLRSLDQKINISELPFGVYIVRHTLGTVKFQKI